MARARCTRCGNWYHRRHPRYVVCFTCWRTGRENRETAALESAADRILALHDATKRGDAVMVPIDLAQDVIRIVEDRRLAPGESSRLRMRVVNSLRQRTQEPSGLRSEAGSTVVSSRTVHKTMRYLSGAVDPRQRPSVRAALLRTWWTALGGKR